VDPARFDALVRSLARVVNRRQVSRIALAALGALGLESAAGEDAVGKSPHRKRKRRHERDPRARENEIEAQRRGKKGGKKGKKKKPASSAPVSPPPPTSPPPPPPPPPSESRFEQEAFESCLEPIATQIIQEAWACEDVCGTPHSEASSSVACTSCLKEIYQSHAEAIFECIRVGSAAGSPVAGDTGEAPRTTRQATTRQERHSGRCKWTEYNEAMNQAWLGLGAALLGVLGGAASGGTLTWATLGSNVATVVASLSQMIGGFIGDYLVVTQMNKIEQDLGCWSGGGFCREGRDLGDGVDGVCCPSSRLIGCEDVCCDPDKCERCEGGRCVGCIAGQEYCRRDRRSSVQCEACPTCSGVCVVISPPTDEAPGTNQCPERRCTGTCPMGPRWRCASPGVCTCDALSCQKLDKECGSHDNGCGETIECGTCASAAKPNAYCDWETGKCACDPLTFCASGECGERPDGCGGKYNCGTCSYLGTNGVCEENRCTCSKDTCTKLGRTCGSWSDGCNGSITCGPNPPCPNSPDGVCCAEGQGCCGLDWERSACCDWPVCHFWPGGAPKGCCPAIQQCTEKDGRKVCCKEGWTCRGSGDLHPATNCCVMSDHGDEALHIDPTLCCSGELKSMWPHICK
jgi:hypothetical protein